MRKPFEQAQQEHVAAVIERFLPNVGSFGPTLLKRRLSDDAKHLQLRKQQANVLGKRETANCIGTAIAAIEDAKEALGE